MVQPLTPEVENCLKDLQSEFAYERRYAAEVLGNLQIHDELIRHALTTSSESDPNRVVRQAASQSLYKLGYAQPEVASLDLRSQGVESKYDTGAKGYNAQLADHIDRVTDILNSFISDE